MLRGLDGMWKVRRHVENIVLFERMRFAGQEEFAFAGQDLNERMLGGGVLGQFLALGKTEQDGPGIFRAQQSAAHNAIGRELRLPFEGKDFFAPRINQRSFVHAGNLAEAGTTVLDLSQWKVRESRRASSAGSSVPRQNCLPLRSLTATAP